MIATVDDSYHFEQFKKGSESALKFFFKSLSEVIHQRLIKRGADYHLAQSIVAYSFHEIWKRRAKIYNLKQLIGELHVIAYRKLYREKGLEKSYSGMLKELSVDMGNTSAIQEDAEVVRANTLALVYSAIDDLPPQKRIVMRLFLEGYSSAEIAEKLDLNTQTILNHKSEAEKMLRQKLGGADYAILLLLLFFIQ